MYKVVHRSGGSRALVRQVTDAAGAAAATGSDWSGRRRFAVRATRFGVWLAAVMVGVVIGAVPQGAALGSEDLWILGPADAVAAARQGVKVRACAPDVNQLPGNFVHLRTPPRETARAVALNVCEVMVVPGGRVDDAERALLEVGVMAELSPLDAAVSALRPVSSGVGQGRYAADSDAAALPFAAADPAPAAPGARASAVEPVELPAQVDRAQSLFFEAFEALKRNRVEKAADLFEQGLRISPDNPIAMFYLATVYERMGLPSDAAVLYQGVVDLSPRSREAASARDRLRQQGIVPARDRETAAAHEMPPPPPVQRYQVAPARPEQPRTIDEIFASSPGATYFETVQRSRERQAAALPDPYPERRPTVADAYRRQIEPAGRPLPAFGGADGSFEPGVSTFGRLGRRLGPSRAFGVGEEEPAAGAPQGGAEVSRLDRLRPEPPGPGLQEAALPPAAPVSPPGALGALGALGASGASAPPSAGRAAPLVPAPDASIPAPPTVDPLPPLPQGERERMTIEYTDGAVYQGQVVNGRPNGEGTLVYIDGSRYDGSFRDGDRVGRGTLNIVGGWRYEGEFRNDRIDGRGTLVWPDGARYEGEFRDGRRTGQGIYTWPGGARFEGQFVDGEIRGRGVYVSADGVRYEGEFRAGQRTGQGTLSMLNGERYEGDVVDGVPHGQGVYLWPDGYRYTGSFSRGVIDGKGTLFFPDGRSQAGNWSNGRLVEPL